MIINVIVTPRAQPSITNQMFDYWVAYKQYQNRDNNYQLDLELKYSSGVEKSALNVMMLDLDTDIDVCAHSDIDLFLLDNSGESLEVSCPRFLDIIGHTSNSFLVMGGTVSRDHPMSSRVITFNHNLTQMSDFLTRPFYPQYYESRLMSHRDRMKNLVFINGENRTNRTYFMDLLTEVPGIDVWNRMGSGSVRLLDCQWESDQDTDFRIWLNETIANEEKYNSGYYENSVTIGNFSGDKFGSVPPGYFLIDLYYQYHSVVYPETSWINDQLFLSEKTWKCLVSRAIPWPVAGSGFHAMMNDHGFSTAWNLLPRDLQAFDAMKDHRQRYLAQSRAVKWAAENPGIWRTEKAQEIRDINYQRFWCTDINLRGIERLDSILTSTHGK